MREQIEALLAQGDIQQVKALWPLYNSYVASVGIPNGIVVSYDDGVIVYRTEHGVEIARERAPSSISKSVDYDAYTSTDLNEDTSHGA